MREDFYRPEDEEFEAVDNRPGLVAKLIILLLVLALLTTMFWPLWWGGPRRQPTPTPSPTLWYEHRVNSTSFGENV
jgi:hypothetical protein